MKLHNRLFTNVSAFAFAWRYRRRVPKGSVIILPWTGQVYRGRRYRFGGQDRKCEVDRK